MRGEDSDEDVTNLTNWGSPPHARGRHGLAFFLNIGGGITPACAGKTVILTTVPWDSEDHPRMRGEDLVRGYRRSGNSGITPACAGKTERARRPVSHKWDHPRMRGEDDCPSAFCDDADGSPPHARGRHGIAVVNSVPPRITPACAGKTKFRRCSIP